MIYNIKDKRAAVYQVQSYLHEIARHDCGITNVYPDGIYDENTEKAVREFQSAHRLPATGLVDRETYDSIYSAYLDVTEHCAVSEKADVFGCLLAGDCISPGDEFDSVYILQVMLSLLSEPYGFEQVGINGRYDEKTENAVRRFQEVHGIEPSGIADRQTRNAIIESYNKFVHETM